MLGTVLQLVTIVMVACLIAFLYIFKREIPDVEQILVDVGESIGEQISGVIEKPVVKASMSHLGKMSGEVRASAALKNKVAEKALGQNVLLKKALEYLDITPIEGLELLNDPTIGPTIRGLMANFQSGIGGALGSGQQGQRQRNNGGQIPNMS